MDFTKLLSIAEKNKKDPKEKSVHRPQFSAPKKEKKDKPRSEVVQKLIDEKNRERELERRRRHEHEKNKRKEEKRKEFVIPKKKVEIKEAIANVLKDLDSSEDELTENPTEETNEKQYDRSDMHEKVTSRKQESGASNKSESSHTHNGHKSHNNHHSSSSKSHSNSDKHKEDSDKHRKDSDKYRKDSDKHRKDSSALKHESDKRYKDSGGSSKHSSSNSSGSRSSYSHHESSHRSHSREKEKPTSDTSIRDKTKSSSYDKSHSSGHKSHKNSSSASKSNSSSSSSSSSKHRSTDTSHSSSRDHKDSSTSSSNRKSSSSSKASSKKSAKDLTLEELREEVRRMKNMEEVAALDEEKEKKENSTTNAHIFEPHKNRQGFELDEAEAKKAKILARTQAILQRTKDRLAKQKETEKQTRHRGKRTSTGDNNKGSSDKQIKSKSIIRDDSDSEDDGTHELDMSFNGNMAQLESKDILKDIKKKIDDKLGNYNFPDRPLKEKSSRIKSARDRSMKLKKKYDDSRNSKHDKKKLMSKQEKMKSLMRNDYQTNFGNKPSFRPKKPLIRRNQQQAPPINFQDLLKIAEQKSQEKVPEPTFVIPKKKVEERPLTQEELDRRKREKESRLRKKEQEELAKLGRLPENDRTEIRQRSDDSPAHTKSKSESSLLKGALTKPVKSKYDVENENVLVCGPSSSKPAKQAAPVESSNPWDRIYGQIQKNNPKAENRKRQMIESDDEEEESDYDMDDDFIDDGNCEEDVSAHIRNIFGYDKRKYRHIDEEDDHNMEASFASVMKEEARSAKIGRMEDLEDIRREEEELRRKKLAKMKKSKHR